MKKNINVNIVMAHLLQLFEQKYNILTFRLEKYNDEFLLVDVNAVLLKEMNLLADDILQKNIHDLCVNLEVDQALKNSNLYTINLNEKLYLVYLKFVKDKQEQKHVIGYCIPLDT